MSEVAVAIFVMLSMVYPSSTLILGIFGYSKTKEKEYHFLGFLAALALCGSIVPGAATFDLVSIPCRYGNAIGVLYFATTGAMTIYLQTLVLRKIKNTK